MRVCISLFLQSEEGKEVVRGARMRDALTGEEWDVRAKVVINATGRFSGPLYLYTYYQWPCSFPTIFHLNIMVVCNYFL